VIAALALVATPANAHNFASRIGGLPGGLIHPFVAPAELTALLALGLWFGQMQVRLRLLLALFAAGLAIGVLTIVSAFSTTHAELFMLGTSAAAGMGALLAPVLPPAIAAAVAMLAGIAIILDAVPEDISMLRTFLALIGTGLTSLATVAFVSKLTAHRKRGWERVGVRVLASWITAGAILVLTLRLVR
jgi:hydrogenase/urease accessory protein HupE